MPFINVHLFDYNNIFNIYKLDSVNINSWKFDENFLLIHISSR